MQAAAEAGMQQKSAEFRQRGGEVYLPADVVRVEAAAEAEETDRGGLIVPVIRSS